VAGWYAPGTRPGDPGSAVILGHVDSKRGPAVFFRLRELRRGDAVTIRRADGSSVRFVVQRTEQYPKDRFPTDAVYYPTLTPALRLVTCGGEFDATIGRYRSNLIVFATMAP
jgi:sortase (surface protein transpeptidase)